MSTPEDLAPAGSGGGSPDGAKNTGASDGTENTGLGQGQRPSSADQRAQSEHTFRQGMARGVAKTLKDLGLDTDDLAEAREIISTLRDSTQSQKSDPNSDTRLADLRATSLKLERELKARDEQIKTLSAQADVARKLAIQQAAASAGVGHGAQAEAFVRLHGDRFTLGSDGEIQALITGLDGEMVPGVVPVSDLIAELLESSPFLRARGAAAGAGSSRSPVTVGQTKEEIAAAESRKLWGRTERAGSPLDRILNRSK